MAISVTLQETPVSVTVATNSGDVGVTTVEISPVSVAVAQTSFSEQITCTQLLVGNAALYEQYGLEEGQFAGITATIEQVSGFGRGFNFWTGAISGVWGTAKFTQTQTTSLQVKGSIVGGDTNTLAFSAGLGGDNFSLTITAPASLSANRTITLPDATGTVSLVGHSHAAGDIASGTLNIARIPTGTSSTTVCIGNDPRLSDPRSPTSHAHGNISNTGLVDGNTASGRVIVTTTGGAVTTATIGSGLTLSDGTLTATGSVADAPSDGITYGRKNASWVDITSPANLQVRRGTAAEVAAITPLDGEPVWATDTKEFFVGDGVTAGGVPVSEHTLYSSDAVAILQGQYSIVGGGAIWIASKCDLASVTYPAGLGSGVNPNVFGNARGLGAVDFTNERTAATQVASGRKAFCGPGANTASGEDSIAMSGGTASGLRSVAIIGGTASAESAVALRGTASGIRSYAFGGIADRASMMALEIANTYAASLGRGQAVIFGMRFQTSSATPAIMRRDGGSGLNGYPIPTNVALFGTVQICAIKTSDGAQSAHYVRKFGIANVNGTTSLLGSVTTVGTDHETDAGMDVSIAANDTNDTLEITVTGIASTTLRWIAVVDGVEFSL